MIDSTEVLVQQGVIDDNNYEFILPMCREIIQDIVVDNGLIYTERKHFVRILTMNFNSDATRIALPVRLSIDDGDNLYVNEYKCGEYSFPYTSCKALAMYKRDRFLKNWCPFRCPSRTLTKGRKGEKDVSHILFQ